jgi:hypothetical protein
MREQGTAGGAAGFLLGRVIKGHSYNGNNICQLLPLFFLASANDGKSDSSVSVVECSNHSSVKDEHSDFSAANKHSANDGNAQISSIFPAEQGAGYDNNDLCADNNGLPEATIDKDDSLPDGFEDERKPTADNTGPPDVKSGFKGKRAIKKFGHYGKRGGNKKINSVPRPVPTDNNMEPHEYQSRCLTSAGRKVTETQIINKLSIVTRQYLLVGQTLGSL